MSAADLEKRRAWNAAALAIQRRATAETNIWVARRFGLEFYFRFPRYKAAWMRKYHEIKAVFLHAKGAGL